LLTLICSELKLLPPLQLIVGFSVPIVTPLGATGVGATTASAVVASNNCRKTAIAQ
jgi:hypothetical protein